MKNKILYTGAFRFPDKDAAAARVLGIGKIFRQLGYEVVYAGWETQPREQDFVKETSSYKYDDFEYNSMNELTDIKNRSFINKMFDYINRGQKTINWLEKQKLNEVYAIIAYNSNSLFLKKLKKLCEQYNILLILDITEWYKSSHLPMGKYGLPALDNYWRMSVINPKIKNLIVISEFLENYYLKKKCNVIKIPPLIDFNDSRWNADFIPRDKQNFSIVYAGSPGQKDLMKNIIESIIILKEDGKKVLLNIYGITVNQLEKYNINSLNIIEKQIICYGRVLQEDIPKYLSKSKYSVLIRPNERYAHAGFSTKIVESMAAGIPVISNNTGEIGSILADDKNGILLRDSSPKELADKIKKLLNQEDIIHVERGKNARAFAKLNFNYSNYVIQLEKFLKTIN